MAIIQAVLAMVFKSAGRLLNTAFGWATIMIFGKVPADRQMYISVIGFGSVAWIIVLLGIVFPRFGTFLLTFVPLPAWVDKTMIRLIMLSLAIVIPPIVGFVSLLLLDPAKRPRNAAEKVTAIFKGYLYTLGLAVTLVMMTVFAPILKLQTLARRWTSQHVPIIVEADDYLAVVAEVQRALEAAGWRTARRQANWMLRAPTKVLTTLAGDMVDDVVADQLTTLRAPNLEVVLHPSDLVISGKEYDVVHARATLAEQLAFSRAYLTWTKEANRLEDRLRRVWEAMKESASGDVPPEAELEIKAVHRDLETLQIPYEEWEVLFRTLLLVERGLLQVAAGVLDHPRAPSEGAIVPQLTRSRGFARVLGTGVVAGWVSGQLLRLVTGRTRGSENDGRRSTGAVRRRAA